MAMSIGFIGVGTLASAMIEGLSCQNDAPDIHVSNRSEKRASALAARFGNVVREPSNQAVVDSADIIFLSVRPRQMAEAVARLHFPAHKRIASLAAGVSISMLRCMVGEDVLLARVLALPSARIGKSPICVYPPCVDLTQALRPLGEPVDVGDEDDLDALVGLGGLMSTYLKLQEEAVGHVVAKGVSGTTACKFVSQMVQGLSANAATGDAEDCGGMVEAHETPGGINQRCRSYLQDAGWFRQFAAAMQAIDRHRLTGGVEREYRPG
jgi:pyrroline-5-carboxylate reductase